MKKILLSLMLFTFFAFSNSVSSQPPINYLVIDEIKEKLNLAPLYVKKGETLGRLPAKSEIGSYFLTLVSDGKGGCNKETENIIKENHIIARMPEAVAEGVYTKECYTYVKGCNIYNEWLVPAEHWKESYGSLPKSHNFELFKRRKGIKAIRIDKTILALLGSTDNESAVIQVDWSREGMKVYKGGYLTNAGYGVAPDEMERTYELSTANLK